ncbi:MAG: HPr family phosphocarrier protein [Kiritimatiellia bacterium]
MVSQRAIIQNEQGIHCRPSAVILKEVASYPGKIRVACDNGESTLDSVLDLMALCLSKGTVITISVDGPDEEAWCDKLVKLFEYHFDFPPRE